jgi:hypothetical protein
MDYKYFTSKLGKKFSIVQGAIVEDECGLFTVSETFGNYVIYLNKFDKSWNIIAPTKSYLARKYIFKKSDCITLNAEWLDDYFKSNYGNFYDKILHREFYNYFKVGMRHWYLDYGFKEVTSPQYGDCIVYEYQPDWNNHVGIYVDNDNILHHPKIYSCIDKIDYAKVLGIFRYGNRI